MRTPFGIALLCGVMALGCSSGSSPDEEEGVFVPEGKEDNFYSQSAQEYFVEGRTTVTIEPELAGASEEVKRARVEELIPLKQIVVGWFLNVYLVEKHSDDANADYGGFHGLTKNGSYEELEITALDDTTYSFTFRQEFGGALDLLHELPTTTGEDGRQYFDLIIGKISNDDMARLETNHEWYRSSPWSAFNPESVDPSRLETLQLAVWREPASTDAWIDYNRLHEDGVLSIDIFFGWDYHSEYHLKHSQTVYEWLVRAGYQSPVGSYEEYTHESGPLGKAIDANGRTVNVAVNLYWGKPGTPTDPDTDSGGRLLEDLMRRSLAERDVIVFSGHSGPFYGFALANWRMTDEGDLDDSEIPGLDMPADRYQLVVAEGCDTYALGEAFRENPNKAGARNIDIITTTSYSAAGSPDTVTDLLNAMAGDQYVRLMPATYSDFLGGLDRNSFWMSTMYGVHGIDDNPHAHPWARADLLCQRCESDSDCGDTGNKCTRLGDSEKVCTYLCTADDGCPDGYSCRSVAEGSWITSHQCAPATMRCGEPAAPAGPVAIINEVFASPKPGTGDANGDGEVSWMADEFIEIVNVSGSRLDLTGWSVADSVMTRMQLPGGTELAPGKALVVFGGGETALFTNLGEARILVSSQNHLGFNNAGDHIMLRDRSGEVIDEMSYGPEGGNGIALTRERDGDATAPFVLHGGAGHSAGFRQDGVAF